MKLLKECLVFFGILLSETFSTYFYMTWNSPNIQLLSTMFTIGEFLFMIESDVPLEDATFVEKLSASFIGAQKCRITMKDLMPKHQRFAAINFSTHIAGPILTVVVFMLVNVFFEL